MSLELQLKERIVAECAKLIDRHHAYHNNLHREWLRNRGRIAGAPEKEIKIPEHWALDPKFNPFHVRRNATAIKTFTDKPVREKSNSKTAQNLIKDYMIKQEDSRPETKTANKIICMISQCSLIEISYTQDL